MRTVEEVLELAGQLKEGFSIRIQNPPWQDLVIADAERSGPNGFPIVWVAHCGQQGTAGFPEMTFEVERHGKSVKITPLSLRRDMISDVEHGAMEMRGNWVLVWHIQRRHVDVAKVWDTELTARGYVQAFKKGNIADPSTDQPAQVQTKAHPICSVIRKWTKGKTFIALWLRQRLACSRKDSSDRVEGRMRHG